MSKFALLATAAFLVAASPAYAALGDNGIEVNGIHLNALGDNGIKINGIHLNALGDNGIHINGIKANGIHLNGLSLGGVDGMKVIGIELPR